MDEQRWEFPIEIADLATEWQFLESSYSEHYVELRRLHDWELNLVVRSRAAGWSWQQISDQMRVGVDYTMERYGGEVL